MAITVRDGNNSLLNLVSTMYSGAHVVHHDLNTEWWVRVSRSLVSGYTLIRVYGENTAVDTTAEDVFAVGGLVTYPAAAAVVATSSSDTNDTSAGTGARTLKLTGLNGSYAVISETINLNGTSTVNSSATFLRLLSAEVMTAGSGGVNAGTITCSIGGNSQQAVPVGYNRSVGTHYTVPAGYTAYPISWYGSTSLATDAYRFQFWVRPFTDNIFKNLHQLEPVQRREDHEFRMAPAITEKSDVTVRALRASGTGTARVHAGYDLLLISNSV